jgi:uncharacterized protein (TIGR03083 family)
MAAPTKELLAGLAHYDPFDIFDTEAARLDSYFSTLDAEGWARASGCEGWSVRDVLGHLAGEELYNHACLEGRLERFYAMLDAEGVTGYKEFNEWCVRRRRGLPVAEVLAEWRDKNGWTRARMRDLGRDAMMDTSVGPYPVGAQTFHYDSEYATHADDVGAPVAPEEAEGRTDWRVRVGLFVLGEQGVLVERGDEGRGDGVSGNGVRGGGVRVERDAERMRVRADGHDAVLTRPDFVRATVGRLPAGSPVPPAIRSALRCLA